MDVKFLMLISLSKSRNFSSKFCTLRMLKMLFPSFSQIFSFLIISGTNEKAVDNDQISYVLSTWAVKEWWFGAWLWRARRLKWSHQWERGTSETAGYQRGSETERGPPLQDISLHCFHANHLPQVIQQLHKLLYRGPRICLSSLQGRLSKLATT